MRKRGVKRKDFGCCPGHDKFPDHSYTTRVSQKLKRRTDQLANKRARLWDRELVKSELYANEKE